MTVLQRLKSETQAVHLQLETALPLLKPELSQSEYRRVLQAFSAVVPALETRLLQLELPAEFDLVAGLRAPRLASDLAYLHVTAAPPVRDWSSFSQAAGLGALYVLEGSRLGGRLISRHLSGLGITPTTGGAYFAEPDEGVVQRWRAFQSALLAHVWLADEDAVVSGAAQTFAAFLQAWQVVSQPQVASA